MFSSALQVAEGLPGDWLVAITWLIFAFIVYWEYKRAMRQGKIRAEL